MFLFLINKTKFKKKKSKQGFTNLLLLVGVLDGDVIWFFTAGKGYF